MKKILFLLLTAMVSLFFLACGSSSEKVLKIGVAGPHTGDLAPYGIPTLDAAKLVFDEVNESGGINGAEIELVIADDVCDPAQATNVASRIAADKVIAVVGHICSGATISALSTYMSEEIPIISPSATAPELTKSGKYTGFFRTIASDDEQGIAQAKFLVDEFAVSKVAIIHDQQDYGKGLADSAKAELEADGVSIAVYEGITVGAVDYSAVVSKIIGAKVDAVVYGGYHPEGSKVITQLRERGYRKVFISGDGLKSADFVALAKKEAEGVYATGPKDYTSAEAYKKAKALYRAAYDKDPGTFYYEGYAAATVLVDAIKAGNTTSQAINDYLYSGANFDTAIGSISFDKSGDSVGTGFSIYQVKDGNFEIVN